MEEEMETYYIQSVELYDEEEIIKELIKYGFVYMSTDIDNVNARVWYRYYFCTRKWNRKWTSEYSQFREMIQNGDIIIINSSTGEFKYNDRYLFKIIEDLLPNKELVEEPKKGFFKKLFN